MEFSYRPIVVSKEEIKQNPDRYFVLDGRKIKSERTIPEALRDILIPQLTGGSVTPEIPQFGGKNDFCQIISSTPTINPITKTFASPQYAFLTQERMPAPTEQFLSNEKPFYLGILLNPSIPELTLKEVNMIVRVPLDISKINPMEGLVNRAPVPAEYQLLGTHDILKDGQTDKDLKWEDISDRTTIAVDSWNYASTTKFILLKENVDPKYLTFRGFKLVVWSWNNEFADEGDVIPGLSRLDFKFKEEDIELLKKREYNLPDLSNSCDSDHVIAFDLDNLEDCKEPDKDHRQIEKEYLDSIQIKVMERIAPLIKKSINDAVSLSVEKSKDKLVMDLSEKVNKKIGESIDQINLAGTSVMADVKKYTNDFIKQLENDSNNNINSLKRKTDKAIKEISETIDEHIKSKVNDAFSKVSNTVDENISVLTDLKNEIMQSVNVDKNIINKLVNDVFEEKLEKIIDEKFSAKQESLINEINSHIKNSITNKNSPLVKILDGIQGAVNKLEQAITKQKERIDDIEECTTLVVVDDQKTGSLNVNVKTNKNQFHVVNEKDHPKKELVLLLKKYPQDGDTITFFNYRTDGGKVTINGNGNNLDVVFKGKFYDHLSKLSLTEKGEFLSLIFFKGVWTGRLEEGIASASKTK